MSARRHHRLDWPRQSERLRALPRCVRPELMAPQKFEVTVATNRGMNGNVFDSENDALA